MGCNTDLSWGRGFLLKKLRFVLTVVIRFGDLLQSTGKFLCAKNDLVQDCWIVVIWDGICAVEERCLGR